MLCGAKDDGDADIQEVAQEIATNGYGEDAEEDRKACRRAEVNLDVIARKFKSGELVTPEALKKKHIISGRCDHVKILARGTLTKPLIVEAHDFSHAAEEMLKASGGEAIRI